jgi:hypothetical protein
MTSTTNTAHTAIVAAMSQCTPHTQTDLQLAREMLKQRAACSDTRTASTWTKEQQDLLDEKIAAAKLGCVFVTVT